MRRGLVVVLTLLALASPAHALLIATEPGIPLVPNSVIELVDKLGYFDRGGVHVTLTCVAGTPVAMAALPRGKGDMANVSLDALLNLRARGETGYRAVSSPNKSFSFVIVARRDIGSVATLRGKVFGVGKVGSLDYSLSSAVLKREHFDPNDMHIVSIGSPRTRLQALVNGKIDATTVLYGTWTPLQDKACTDGCFSRSDLESSAQFWHLGRPNTPIPALATWTDFSVLADALRQLDGTTRGASR